MNSPCETSDLLAISHLRWEVICQRPDQVFTLNAEHRRVYFFEEPIYGLTEIPRLHLKETSSKVQVVIPHLPSGLNEEEKKLALRELMNELIYEEDIRDFTLCYSSSKALDFSDHLKPSVVIFDSQADTSFNEQEIQVRELNRTSKLKDYKMPAYMDPSLMAIGIV